MFAVWEVILYAIIAGVLVTVVLATLGRLGYWDWPRHRWRFAVAGLATTVGFIAWNLTLNVTNAIGFDVDAPVIGLSWQDAGSGVLALSVSALALGLAAERREPAGQVVGAATVAGLVAMIFDIFVL